MSDLKNWYLGGMVVAADKAEFKEDEHPRGKGGMFVKKGEGGGSSSALEEVYKKGGFKNPDALAKADLEELGKMSDSRLDAEITMLKGKVEEGGKPLDKARLEAAEGIMKGRGEKKADTNGKIEGDGEESLKKAISELSDDRLDIAIKNGERNAKREDLSEEQRKRYERTLPYLKDEKAKRGGDVSKLSDDDLIALEEDLLEKAKNADKDEFDSLKKKYGDVSYELIERGLEREGAQRKIKELLSSVPKGKYANEVLVQAIRKGRGPKDKKYSDFLSESGNEDLLKLYNGVRRIEDMYKVFES